MIPSLTMRICLFRGLDRHVILEQHDFLSVGYVGGKQQSGEYIVSFQNTCWWHCLKLPILQRVETGGESWLMLIFDFFGTK